MSNDQVNVTPPGALALKVLMWLAVGTLLYFGKLAFAPVLFAILFAVLLSPFVDWLQRHRVHRTVGSILVVGVLVAAVVTVVDAAWSPALSWIESAPAVMQKVERKVRPAQRLLSRIESVTTRASALTGTQMNKSDVVFAAPTAESGLLTVSTLRLTLINVVMVALLTVFMLIGGGITLHNMERAMLELGFRHHYLQLVEKVRVELGRYFATLAAINVGLGVVTGAVMAAWGLPSPWLWGVMAGVLNFLPYLGPTVSLLVMTVVSLVTFEGYGPAIGVAGSFLLITTIEGQVVQPLLVGYRLNLNPLVLFIGIWLAGWFWGIAGVALVTPVLITLKELANQQSGPSVLRALLLDRNVPPVSAVNL